jgi:hypothetical protein
VITSDAAPSRSGRAVYPSAKNPPFAPDILNPELKVATRAPRSAAGTCPASGQTRSSGSRVPAIRCAATRSWSKRATPTTTVGCAGSGRRNVEDIAGRPVPDPGHAVQCPAPDGTSTSTTPGGLGGAGGSPARACAAVGGACRVYHQFSTPSTSPLPPWSRSHSTDRTLNDASPGYIRAAA